MHVWLEKWDPLQAGRLAAYSLLISNGIRRDVTVVIDTVYNGYETRLVITPRVRHLRMDEDSLEGFMKRVLVRGASGVTVARPRRERYKLCISCSEPSEAWRPVADPIQVLMLRDLGTVALVHGCLGGYCVCEYILVLEACRRLAPWLGISAALIMLDWVAWSDKRRGARA